MKTIFRATETFMTKVRSDLLRVHPFAWERVGFITVRSAYAGENLLLFAQDYFPVSDNDYLPDETVGAKIGHEGFRKVLEIALLNPVGIFHVHRHLDSAHLWFSRTDLREQLRFVPDFFKVRPNMPHGALVLDQYSAAGRIWLDAKTIMTIAEFNIVGNQVTLLKGADDSSVDFYV
jgi:hypothetical protein